MSNVTTIIKATEITENVHGQGNVNLVDYIKNQNLAVFTRTNGARDMVANLDYTETKEDIEIALINSAITRLEHPDYVQNLANRLPWRFIEWAKLQKPVETINEIFAEEYANPSNSVEILASLRESRNYSDPEYERYSKEVADLIELLENAKEKIKTKQNDIVK